MNGIESFAFDRTGQSIAMKRYAPVAPAPAGGAARRRRASAWWPGAGGPGAAAPAAAIGTTLIVRNLATGADMTFGNVTEFAWQPTDTGRLLAMVISADGQAGNGVQMYDAATSVLRVLESTATDYSALVVARRLVGSARDESEDRRQARRTDAGRAGVDRRRHAHAETAARSITRRATRCRRRSASSRSAAPSWMTGPPERRR